MSGDNIIKVTIYRINIGIEGEPIGKGIINADELDSIMARNTTVAIKNAQWLGDLTEGALAIARLNINPNKNKEFIVSPASGGGIASGTNYTRRFVFYKNKIPVNILFKNDFGSYDGKDNFIAYYSPDPERSMDLYVQPGGDHWPFSVSAGINVMVLDKRNERGSDNPKQYTTQSTVKVGDQYDDKKPLHLIIPDHS